MLLKQFIDLLEANEMPYYVQDGPRDGEWKIGVPTQDGNVYFWFRFFIENYDGDNCVTGTEHMYFLQRYNRAIGKRLNSHRTGFNFTMSLAERKVAQHRRGSAKRFDCTYRGDDGLIANRA